jgi:hypothetical protein
VSALKILISGTLAGAPGQGGAAWALLQYVIGLRRLGHNVCFVEQLPEAGAEGTAASNAYFRDVMRHFGLDGVSSLIDASGNSVSGLERERVRDFASSSDLLLNISGSLRDGRLMDSIPVRAFLDLDPAFTQMWQAVQGVDMNFAAHTHFLTIGEALGTSGYVLPDAGLPWQTVRQPVVLDEWPVATEVWRDAFTTIANWRAYGSIEYEGVFYGQKAHSLREFIDLPVHCNADFALALSIHPDEMRDLAALRDNGWSLLDPCVCAGSPQAYREFVQTSRAEFGIAKSGYVKSRCGWFSDRSACYLASGRPVIAQETGFGDYLPTGLGLHAFSTAEDVVAAAQAIRGDYERQARAAREIAEAYFNSDSVLTRLLEKLR